MADWGFTDDFPQYVSAAERRARALRAIEDLRQRGVEPRPVVIEGTKIARTFWGKAWCDNLIAYSDYETRLPRGRAYVRNGSVIHLEISPKQIQAFVSGTDVYDVRIGITALEPERWSTLVKECAGKIHNVVDLLMGRLSPSVMEVLCRKEEGLFPAPEEIELDCSCPDGARLCKHVASVLYGVGARLDTEPELLFVLRDVDKLDLVEEAGSGALAQGSTTRATIPRERIASVFGVELADDGEPIELPASRPPRRRPRLRKKR